MGTFNKVFNLFRGMKYRRMVEYRQIRNILEEGIPVEERKISAVVAVDKNWGIGHEGRLLVHLPGELKHFKEITLGHIVVMGRTTFESLPSGPLPGRVNVVLSRSMDPASNVGTEESLIIENDFSEMLNNVKALQAKTGKDIFVIGGGSVYSEFLPIIDHAYVTKINEEFDADTFFPNLDADANFKLYSETEWAREGYHKYRYCVYERR